MNILRIVNLIVILSFTYFLNYGQNYNEIITQAYSCAYIDNDYQKAAELFEKCYKMNPNNLYAPIWRYIALKKIGVNTEQEFAKFAETINGDNWPIPIIQYYAGKRTKKECLQASISKDKNRENEKRCEAYYFIGEFLILNNQKNEGVKLLKKCIECDIQNFREYKAAKLELTSETE
jgi:lipoprotein NlpI